MNLKIISNLICYKRLDYNITMIRIYYNRIINYINYINRKFRNYIGYYYLNKHKLNDWSIHINKTKKIAACTDYENKSIYISIYFLDRLSIFEYRNLVLHEISHALIYDCKPHSKNWKEKFKSIGGNGEIYTRNVFTNNDYSYFSICKYCDKKYFCFRRTKIHCDLCGKYLKWKRK